MTYPRVHDLERAHAVTWQEPTWLEPRLAELLWQARADGARGRDREDVVRAFAPLRGALAELIGFLGRHRDCPVLGSVGAYEVAYWRLHEAVSGLLPRPATVQDAVEEPATARSERGRDEAA
jgi:hypothetical protein